MKKIYLILLQCLILSISGCHTKKETASDRYNKLIAAIEGDHLLAIRAIQELGVNFSNDQKAQERLIKHLFSDRVDRDSWEFYVVVNSLLKTNQSLTEKLLEQYSLKEEEGVYLEKLLFILGRLGLKAKEAVPFLLEQLEKYKGDNETEGAIRIVLANAGFRSEDNLKVIMEDINNQNERAKAEIEMLAFTGSDEWFDESFIKEFNQWLAQSMDKYDKEETPLPIDEISNLSMILGRLHSIDSTVEARMKNFIQTKCKTQDDEFLYDVGTCLSYMFLLAKSNNENSKVFLGPALRYMSYVSPSRQGIGKIVADYIIGSDKELLREISAKLEDDDPEVVRGALWVFLYKGLEAKEYKQDILELLNHIDRKIPVNVLNDPNCSRILTTYADIKRTTADALAFLAEPSDIHTLEDLLKNKIFEDVKEEIKNTIRILKLEKSNEDY